MTPERRRAIEFQSAALTTDERAAGYHFCPDWDFQLIGPGDPEEEACVCGLGETDKLKKDYRRSGQ